MSQSSLFECVSLCVPSGISCATVFLRRSCCCHNFFSSESCPSSSSRATSGDSLSLFCPASHHQDKIVLHEKVVNKKKKCRGLLRNISISLSSAAKKRVFVLDSRSLSNPNHGKLMSGKRSRNIEPALTNFFSLPAPWWDRMKKRSGRQRCGPAWSRPLPRRRKEDS